MWPFDLFKRKGKRPTHIEDERSEASRIDFLLALNHDRLEKPKKAYGGVNFLELVQNQLEEGRTVLATSNITSQVEVSFELANLYWGQGDLKRAEFYFYQTLERHQRLVEVCLKYDLPRRSYHAIEYAKCSACLLGVKVDDFTKGEAFNLGYEPWFKDTLLSYCLDSRDFDVDTWQASAYEWTKKRHPKYRLEEFSIYVKALTGQYESSDEMLAEHEQMFTRRANRNPDSGLLDGYYDNELVIDYIFAAILKRIGWEGRYRHSWPNTGEVGSTAHTTKQPDRYLRAIAPLEPEPNADTGIIEDEQDARRYVDIHLQNQRAEDGSSDVPLRARKESGKVAKALKSLGWTGDPASLELMRIYRMDRILNDSTHIFLCDPVGGASIKLEAWTKLLSDDFGMHPDFLAIAGSEEQADYRDPQGSWYVYWKKDKKIYAVDRDEWDTPEVATKGARIGLNLWPSYTSFIAWWISEHLRHRT